MTKSLFTALALFAAGTAGAANHDMLNFEAPATLDGIHVAGGGRVSLSDRRRLSGGQSIRWDFVAGSKLIIPVEPWYLDDRAAAAKFGQAAKSVLIFNVYSEQALPAGRLDVGFGRRGESAPDCRFDFYLNFTGWRTAWVAYSRDMTGTPREDMNEIVIAAPADTPSGTLFFDNLIPGGLYDERFQEPDLQAPSVTAFQRKVGKPWELTGVKPKVSGELTAAEQAGFRLLETRLDADLTGGLPDGELRGEPLDRALARIKKALAASGIHRTADGRILGPPLTYGIHSRQYQFIRDPEKYVKGFLPMRKLGDLMLDTAKTFRRAAPPEARAALRQIYFDLYDYLRDQGYVYGSSIGCRAIVGYQSREVFVSFLLMRQPLADAGLNAEISRTGIWHYDLNSFLDASTHMPPDSDFFTINSRSALISILMMPDTPEKAGYLAAFAGFCSKNIGWLTPGWLGGFKPDGCAYHHWGHYPSYVFGGMTAGAALVWNFHGTPWALADAAAENLRRSLKAAFIYCNPDLAVSLHGRSPFRDISLFSVSNGYRYLAMTGDREMAQLYLAAAPGEPSRKRFPGVEPAPLPQGHWSFTYGGFGIHRFGEKMVTLKGFNRYIWAAETYIDANRYGRYLSNGSIDIMPRAGAAAAGKVEAGWDWNRIPGATILYRPWDELDSPNPRNEMITAPGIRTSGSSHLRNLYGAFGCTVVEPDRRPYDPRFHAVKSVFAFGPRLVALGSDIRASSSYPVETVLFQYESTGENRPGYFNDSTPITGSGVERSSLAPCWAADAFDNAWFVLGGGEVRFRRGPQESRDQANRKPTAGNFSTAYLAHGVQPDNAGYEILIVLDLKAADAPAFAAELQSKAKKPYTVLRRDAAAHAVRDRETGVTAAILFAPQETLDIGLLRAAAAPCYVLMRSPDADTLELSLNTPDLAGFTRHDNYYDMDPIEEDPAAEQLDRVVAIRLDGEWLLRGELPPGATVAAADGTTEITGHFRHGIPLQLELVRKNKPRRLTFRS
jgi:chondroitin-sulfate-ABC endolyase/exolyase